MGNKAVFLDRDGTINVDYGYVYETEKLRFIPGVIPALKKLREIQYKLIIITNQSGIGRGYYTQRQFFDFQEYMNSHLKNQGAEISAVYYCPHTDADLCDCRKPKTELFYRAAEELNIDFDKSYAIGDKERDLSICEFEPVKGILLSRENNEKYKAFAVWRDIASFILNNSFD